MSLFFLPDYSLAGIIAACLLMPPLLGGFLQCVTSYYDAKKMGRCMPPLLQPFYDFFAMLRHKPVGGSGGQVACVLLSMTFQLMALGVLGLQRNVPFILFLQAFGALALIIGSMSRPVPYYGLSVNHELRAVLTEQPILFLAAVGIFFSTGSFNFAAFKEYPRMLAIDLPLLCTALLLVDFSGRRAVNDSETGGPVLAFVMLAKCYRTATLLLLAGFFFSHSLHGAALVAAVVYVIGSIWSSQSPAAEILRLYLDRGWGYVYFACGLNLAWVYIKYWL